MTINQIIEKIMVALDEVSSPNLLVNEAEYIDKIFPLIDSVQREIATILKPIKKYSDVISLNKRIDMPSDCYELLKVYDSGMKPVSFDTYSSKIFIMDETLSDGTFTLYYNKYPDTINANTPRATELEVSKECQEALVYGVCAGLTINDEPELYDTYMDKYNVMLANIQLRMQNGATAKLVGGLRI